MRPRSQYLPVRKEEKPVAIDHCRQPVRHHDHRFPLHLLDPLNGTDADLDIIRDIGTIQAANAIQFRERAVLIIRAVRQEFAFRLFPKRLGVHQEQNTLHFPVFQKTIACCDRRKSLPRAGRHLHQRLWPIIRKRSIQILNGLDLALPEASSIEGREIGADFQLHGFRVYKCQGVSEYIACGFLRHK